VASWRPPLRCGRLPVTRSLFSALRKMSIGMKTLPISMSSIRRRGKSGASRCKSTQPIGSTTIASFGRRTRASFSFSTTSEAT
jgi:hypothetical protein